MGKIEDVAASCAACLGGRGGKKRSRRWFRITTPNNSKIREMLDYTVRPPLDKREHSRLGWTAEVGSDSHHPLKLGAGPSRPASFAAPESG